MKQGIPDQKPGSVRNRDSDIVRLQVGPHTHDAQRGPGRQVNPGLLPVTQGHAVRLVLKGPMRLFPALPVWVVLDILPAQRQVVIPQQPQLERIGFAREESAVHDRQNDENRSLDMERRFQG